MYMRSKEGGANPLGEAPLEPDGECRLRGEAGKEPPSLGRSAAGSGHRGTQSCCHPAKRRLVLETPTG